MSWSWQPIINNTKHFVVETNHILQRNLSGIWLIFQPYDRMHCIFAFTIVFPCWLQSDLQPIGLKLNYKILTLKQLHLLWSFTWS